MNNKVKGIEIVVKKNNGILTPFDLPQIINQIPSIHPNGVVIGGRLPVWAYGAIVHHLHPSTWVAVYDPRLGGIVVMTHTIEKTLGEIILLDHIEWERILI
jgi:CRISPR-associated protein Csx3